MPLDGKLTKEWAMEDLGVNKYHAHGFKGKGITILNHEADDEDHGGATASIIRKIAPEANVVSVHVSSKIKNNKCVEYNWYMNGVKYTVDEIMDIVKPDIISVSLRGEDCPDREKYLKKYIDNGSVILCNSTGNNGIVEAYYKNIALNIGSVQYFNSRNNISIVPYSGRDEGKNNVAYVCFQESLGGTSASCPYFAALLALFMSRYNVKLSQEEVKKVLKQFCNPIGKPDETWKYGDGLFILPDPNYPKEKIFTDIKGKEIAMAKFKDIDDNRWSAEDINWCVENGYLKGYPDGTFMPEAPITREQLAVIIRRLKDN